MSLFLRRMVFYVFKYIQDSDLINILHVINVNNVLNLHYALFYVNQLLELYLT